MLRATTIVRRPAVKPERVADRLVLDHEARHRRRLSLTGQGGLSFLLDLERATVLDDGDAVKLDDGRLVVVEAAPERLIEITTENPVRLMKVAWHIGNRHVAAEIAGGALFIAYDHVLLEMVRGLGATAREVERPFRPERGAYEGGHGHAHEHGDHDHDHAHAHDHRHDHAGHGHDHHAQAGACGCGHDHAHDHHHGHDHAASHAEAHSHGHSHAQAHAHSHGHRHD